MTAGKMALPSTSLPRIGRAALGAPLLETGLFYEASRLQKLQVYETYGIVPTSMDTPSTEDQLTEITADYLKTVVEQVVPAIEKTLAKVANDTRKSALGATLVARNATISAKNEEIARLRERMGKAPSEQDIEKRRSEQVELQTLKSMARRVWFCNKENVFELPVLVKEIDDFQVRFGTLNLTD